MCLSALLFLTGGCPQDSLHYPQRCPEAYALLGASVGEQQVNLPLAILRSLTRMLDQISASLL